MCTALLQVAIQEFQGAAGISQVIYQQHGLALYRDGEVVLYPGLFVAFSWPLVQRDADRAELHWRRAGSPVDQVIVEQGAG